MTTNEHGMPGVEREEILIGRVVDAEAGPEDWRELEAIGARDPFVWRRLADAQRDHDGLRAAFACAAAPTVEAVEAPAHVAQEAGAMMVRLRCWSGWGAAACLGAALLSVTGAVPGLSARHGGQVAGLSAPLTMDEAMDSYLKAGEESGRVVTQLPKTVIECVESPAGGFEVVFVRQILERATVKSAVEIHWDETGSPVLRPMSEASGLTGRPL